MKYNIFKQQRLKYLLIAWAVIILLVIVQTSLGNLYKGKESWTFSGVCLYLFMQFCIGCALIFFYVVPLYDRIKNISSNGVRYLAHILHGIGFGLLNIAAYAYFSKFKKGKAATDNLTDSIMELFTTDYHNSIKGYLIFLAILYAYDYFKQHEATIIRQKDLENEMDKVKLQSLRAQLQPHFLFNALNNVVALIDENKQQAQRSLIQLSDLLRYTVNLKPSKLVTIQEEIDTIKKYICIEKAKYESQLDIKWEIAPTLSAYKVPPLIMQPLVENAIKHGFRNIHPSLTIVISVGDGYIEVKNNGSPLEQPITNGNGLTLVEKRLAAHFGDRAAFALTQKDNWITSRIEFHDHI